MPILKSRTLEFVSHSAQQTARLGFRLGKCRAPLTWCVYRAAGGGKTAFARGVGQGWAAIPAVTSPTSVLVHEHTRARMACACTTWTATAERGGRCPHLRAGRAAGLLQPSLLIEWPERTNDLLPAERLWITFVFQEDDRRLIRFEASGERYEDLADQYRKRTFGG